MKLQVTLFCLLHLLLPKLCASWSNYIVPYKEEFNITCPIYFNSSSLPHIYWILPSRKLVTTPYLDDPIQISSDPATNLTIKSILWDTFGVYYCLAVWENQTLDMAAVGINVDVTLWHLKYRSKFINGLISAACLLLFMIAFFLVTEFQYKEPNNSSEQEMDNCSISLADVSADNAKGDEKTNSGIEQASISM